jgi:chromate reductase
VRILAPGGSLRTGSWNRALLQEAAGLMQASTELDVERLKTALSGAEGLLLSMPEYNWGIPGFLKNAIDHAWERFAQDAWLMDGAARERLQLVVSGVAAYCERLPPARER